LTWTVLSASPGKPRCSSS